MFNLNEEEEYNPFEIKEMKYEQDSLTQYHSPSEELLERARSIVVKDEQSLQEVLSIYAEAKPVKNEIESLRKDLSRPYRDKIAQISEAASFATEKLDLAIELANKKASEYRKYVDYQNKIEQEAAIAVGSFVEIIPKEFKGEGSTAVTKTIKKYNLVNINNVPVEYLTLNDKLITFNINNGIASIAGIEIYEETKTSLRLKGVR